MCKCGVVLSALLGSLAMTMVWGRKPASWFPSCVWGLWGVGWWFDNWIVDASIHLPVWWVYVCSHTLIALFCGVVGCGVF